MTLHLRDIDTDAAVQLRGDLTARLGLCAFDELRVLDVILRRLELGRERYGYLDLRRDPRDWKREEAEEHVDAAVYRACDVLSDTDDRDELDDRDDDDAEVPR